MERVLSCPVHTGASWNGWALSRETCQLPLRRRDPDLGQPAPATGRRGHCAPSAHGWCGPRCAPSSGLARRRRRHAHPDHCSDACDVRAVTPAPSCCRRRLVPAVARFGAERCRRAPPDRFSALDRRGRVPARLFGAGRLQQSLQAMAQRNTTGVPPASTTRSCFDKSARTYRVQMRVGCWVRRRRLTPADTRACS